MFADLFKFSPLFLGQNSLAGIQLQGSRYTEGALILDFLRQTLHRFNYVIIFKTCVILP